MIEQNIKIILSKMPPDIQVVAAAKSRGVDEIRQAVSAGIKVIGENYVKEALDKFEIIGREVEWHLIGHLQKNKVKKAVKIFDMIETLDCLDLAESLNAECRKIDKIMPVLIEVNSASEPQKYGLLNEEVESFLAKVDGLKNLKFMGLMTMGPFTDDREVLRDCFKKTKYLFEKVKLDRGDLMDWKYLSMGMSSSYDTAIEQGANIVRIGTAIFGPRTYKKKCSYED